MQIGLMKNHERNNITEQKGLILTPNNIFTSKVKKCWIAFCD